MRPNFQARFRYVAIAALFSTVIGLSAALIVCWAKGPGMDVLAAGSTAFLASMTLAVAVIAVLLQ
ncbi:hypothetical protein ABT104_19575 [Streptomyces mobaraensis]|uniref:hypothetical protein n=1 Tax=Streptomyces mobaraensis TaxID=35621 RepID=UPI003321DD7F